MFGIKPFTFLVFINNILLNNVKGLLSILLHDELTIGLEFVF